MARTIKDYQERLIVFGFDVGPDGADGVGGTNTQKALMRFQQARQLKITGQLDPATRVALFPEDAPPERKSAMNNILGNIFSGLLGNLLNWQLVQGYIRQILLAASGALVANGVISAEQQSTVVGALLLIGGVIWATLSNNTKKKAMDVVKAVDAAPNVTVIPASETTSGKPKVVAQP